MSGDVFLNPSAQQDRASQLLALRRLVRDGSHTQKSPLPPAFTAESSPAIGLGQGMVHEWLGVQEPADITSPRRRACWSPCLSVLLDSARNAAARISRPEMVWVGSAVWPYPSQLARFGSGERSGLERCLFVRATRASDRLWAADLALRSSSTGAVIVDGSGFDMASTRRLQLAAEVGGGVCLLARPPWERSELSAAATRWMVSRCPSPSMMRRWTVELLRCKGMPPASHAASVWTLERDHATSALRVVADVLDGSGEATIPSRATG